MSRRYCVIIPALNAGKTIGPLVTEIKAQGLDVVVVDDGSADETAAVASAKGARVISHLQRVGKGGALQAGFRLALGHRYDGVITMDSDGQHRPSDVTLLIQAAELYGAGIVLGNRMGNWRIDILTPAEFAKSLETLEQTIKPIEGVTEEMLDRMGALGMISVFDIEEVGMGVLQEELVMPEPVAQTVVDTCIVQAKIVAEQQQKEKEEAAQRRAEEEAAATALLSGGGAASTDSGLSGDVRAEAAAASILGQAPQQPIVENQPQESGSTDTVEALATEVPSSAAESVETAPDDEPATTAMSDDEAAESADPPPPAEPSTDEEAESVQPRSGAGE